LITWLLLFFLRGSLLEEGSLIMGNLVLIKRFLANAAGLAAKLVPAIKATVVLELLGVGFTITRQIVIRSNRALSISSKGSFLLSNDLPIILIAADEAMIGIKSKGKGCFLVLGKAALIPNLSAFVQTVSIS
jgi:hypothetical protein